MVEQSAGAIGVGAEAISGGEDDELMSGDHGGDVCGEAVVIAEFNFFVGDDIVFIDDGDDVG